MNLEERAQPDRTSFSVIRVNIQRTGNTALVYTHDGPFSKSVIKHWGSMPPNQT